MDDKNCLSDTCGMDESMHSELLRALWAGLCGQQEQTRRAVERLAKAFESGAPDLAARCRRLLTQAVPAGQPLREAAGFRATPAWSSMTDKDSRLNLLLIEPIPKLAVEPRWDPSVVDTLNRLITERRMRKELAAKKLTPTRTALFVGAPGQGKTLAARLLARQLGVPLHTVNLAAVVSSYLGRTGANLQQLMAASAEQPCVLLLDELDCLAKRRGDPSDVGEMNRLVTVILQQLDSWSDHSLLVAATNHSDLLDPAVWRRFEVVIQFPPPSHDDLASVASQILDKEDANGAKAGLEALIEAHVGGSFSDFTTSLEQARRTSVVTGTDLGKALLRSAAQQVSQQTDKGRRKGVASALRGAGWTERDVREVTGLSRDLIRKLPGGRTHG